VVRQPKGQFDRRALFEAFGRAVANLNGQYVTAEDVGTTPQDMALVRTHTAHVDGLPLQADGVGGDPSPWTAQGVFLSMDLAAHRRLHRPLSDCTIAIQGVGHVGAAGILSAKADIFAPCALGGVIDEVAAGKLRAKVVCGAANNQLATTADGDRLAERDILYAPDYVVNAGGIINVAAEYLGWPQADSNARVEATADRLADVFTHAETHGVAPHTAADQLARQRIANASLDAPDELAVAA